ncbi:MAG: phosphate ABC transporter ATP-binding protein, partial [Coprobacillaceae bacterium]
MEDIKFNVKNLDLYYGDFQALKNINLAIRSNKVTALIGPSGCGKSTFLRTLNRMNDLVDNVHIDGEIDFANHNLLSKDIDVIELRTKVGMVFQNPNPFPMSIFDNVAYGPRCQGIKDKKELSEIVETSLKQAALWDEVKDRLNKNAMGM